MYLLMLKSHPSVEVRKTCSLQEHAYFSRSFMRDKGRNKNAIRMNNARVKIKYFSPLESVLNVDGSDAFRTSRTNPVRRLCRTPNESLALFPLFSLPQFVSRHCRVRSGKKGKKEKEGAGGTSE